MSVASEVNMADTLLAPTPASSPSGGRTEMGTGDEGLVGELARALEVPAKPATHDGEDDVVDRGAEGVLDGLHVGEAGDGVGHLAVGRDGAVERRARRGERRRWVDGVGGAPVADHVEDRLG